MPISCNHLLVYYNPEGQVLILEFWGDGNGKRWKDEILTRESTAQDDTWGLKFPEFLGSGLDS
jgi:hypothetical protein